MYNKHDERAKRRVQEKTAREDGIKAATAATRDMVNSLRELKNVKPFQTYTYALNAMLESRKIQREGILADVKGGGKSLEEYATSCIILDTEIKLLYSIIKMPEVFEEQLQKLIGDKQDA